MNPTFEEYGVTKGSDFVPDIASHLERTMSDSAHQKPLSDKAYSRFCRALGRLSWLSQVRHDLKAWLSLLGTQQQQPKHGTEQTLKAVLRFLLFVPSEQGHEIAKSGFRRTDAICSHLHSFSDASHGPYTGSTRERGSVGEPFFLRAHLSGAYHVSNKHFL